MNQPSIKIKKEAFQLPVENIKRYLSGAVPLIITPAPPKSLHIPRKLLRITYGGSDQQFVAHCDVNKSPFSRRASDQSQRHIVFPVPDLNPYMPTSPGDTGLIFASRHEVLEDPPWSVFRRVRESPAVWEYQGEYLCTLCGKMTASEFSSQRIEVCFPCLFLSFFFLFCILPADSWVLHVGEDDLGEAYIEKLEARRICFHACPNCPTCKKSYLD